MPIYIYIYIYICIYIYIYLLSQYRNLHISWNYSVAESVTVAKLLLFIHMMTYSNHDFINIV